MSIFRIVVLWFGFCLSADVALAAIFEDSDVPIKTTVSGAAGKEKSADDLPPLDYIAIVNGEQVPMDRYVSTLRRGLRERFYHGKIPEEEGNKFRKEIADELIDKTLLVQEAKRRQLKPDADVVEVSVKAFDAKFQDDPEWEKVRETILPQVRAKLSDDSLATVLEKIVRGVAVPSETELRQYYDQNNDLFTTPERVRVSLILLRVDPASTPEVWQQASDEATSIVERINSGGDFAELARIHSSDKSAHNGGDMGFVHVGMLGVNAQKVLNILEPGEMSAPVVLLEGVSIFFLEEREQPKLNLFAAVKERAEKLYKREKGDGAWESLLAKLHKAAKIEVNDAPWR